ncbi:hypothetical protein [Rummeliibacillus sp. TYF-LIM-RU47]|uniref:SF0329 family protein n=1 Tax=unclassified Rummeliibacillus TaxID=2622809 RepID=UPI001239EF1D|nr:hypothetical protein [Rummeliibacillus sp. TYF-LIM-RU47]
MLYSPKWSKAKKQLKSFTCESLRSRVDFQVINYRRAHDQLGRAVITVDKVEKLNMCTLIAEREEFRKKWAIRKQLDDFNFDDVTHNRDLQDEAHQLLKNEAIYGQYDFFFALEQYFNASIQESRQSSDILIKILSLLDRRIGKRSLMKINDTIANEHPFVQDFFKLRCEAENIRIII